MLGAVVIGGGQAGLAAGYYLQRQGVDFRILDANARTGDSWRSRYDSLVLFTPAGRSALPGLPFSGDPQRYPTKDEVADYLEGYVRTFRLPVEYETPVLRVSQVSGGFEVVTPDARRLSRAVVVATGPFQVPFLPPLAAKLAPDVFQLHSSAYRNPGGLPEGRVLVVGSGNSGAQIAEELTRTHEVTVALGRKQPVLPQRILGRDVFDALELLGVLNVPASSWLGQRLQRRDPVIGTDLRRLERQGRLTLTSRVVDVEGRALIMEAGKRLKADAVVWATGFRPEYSWLDADVLDNRGWPVHIGGVTQVPGLAFVGLPWQRTRGSALLTGVGPDAEAVVREATTPA